LLENVGKVAGFLMKLDTRLDTLQASAFLTELGYKTAPATLNKKRCVGGGPEFELFGRRPLYTEKALLEWVQARTTPPLRSTSHLAQITARSLQPKPCGRGPSRKSKAAGSAS
jgi:hypothetical protein